MNRKIVSLALGAMAVFASVNALAALDEAEKMYVDRMLKGSWISLRDVAQSLYNTGNTNTEVLDVQAETLLERYQRSGEDRDAVDAVAWMCRALGASGNGRYRAVLERVENDKSVHRKARGHCEKAAKGLPKAASNPYTAGTVNLELLRNPPPPPPPPAPAGKGKKTAKGTPAPAAKPAAVAATAPAAAPAEAKK